MLTTAQSWRRGILAAHEAGHALANKLIGIGGIIASIDAEGSGGVVHHDPIGSVSELDGRRGMLVICAGRIAEELLINSAILERFFPDDRRFKGRGSDEYHMIGLAERYGGPGENDPVNWTLNAQRRCREMLIAHQADLNSIRMWLDSGSSLRTEEGPLRFVQKDLSWARPW